MSDDWKKGRGEQAMREAGEKRMKEAREEAEKKKGEEYRTPAQIGQKIRDWEMDFGESFTDRFMHDNVNNQSWAFWLLGKGLTIHANRLIDKMSREGASCFIDQDELYDIHGAELDGEWDDLKHGKNTALWGEFLSDSTHYSDKVNNFFKED